MKKFLVGVISMCLMLFGMGSICSAKEMEISIAMDTSWTPYAYYEKSTGEVQGVIRNLLDLAAEKEDIKVTYVPYSSYTEALDAVQSGACELVSGVAEESDVANRHKVQLTDSYITIRYCAVTKVKIDDLYINGSDYRVAVCRGSYSTTLMKEQMPQYQFIEYDNNAGCINAITSGEADMALVASCASSCYLSQAKYHDLYSFPINEFSWPLCFGVNNSVDTDIIDRINDGISQISIIEFNQAVTDGMFRANEENRTFMDIVYKYPLQTAVTVSSLFCLIAALVLYAWNRKKKLERLQAQTAMQAEFFTRMSHDIRTPMNSVIGFAEIAGTETKEEKTADYLQKIHAAGEYLLGLVNDVLDMTKIENNAVKLQPEPYPLWEFDQSIDSIIRPLMEKKHIDFVYQMHREAACIMTDKLRFNQIMFNLLSNASKFTPEGGKVEFLSEEVYQTENRHHIRFIIRDNGIGMSEEFQKHMYEGFSQEKEHITTEQGTGLGLAIVASLVKLLQGTIKCKSAPGCGTEFTVELDLEVCAEPEGKRSEESDLQKLQGKRVLLCEDHPLNAEIACKLLEKKGMHPEVAENGKLGVEKFSQSKNGYYHLVLMDIRMPVMNGLEAAQAIRVLPREDAKTVPIIAMTANAFAEDVQNSLNAGMNAHLAKPIEPAKMYHTIADFLD